MDYSEFALKRKVNFYKLCATDMRYELKIKKGLLERLQKACHGVGDAGSLSISFYHDLQGLATVSGEISIEVELICQRCLKPYRIALHSKFCSTPDEAKAKSLRLEDKLDFIELDEDGQFDALSYLEDCLLLELPLVCEHENEEECSLKGRDWVFEDSEEMAKASPFAALQGLKNTLREGR